MEASLRLRAATLSASALLCVTLAAAGAKAAPTDAELAAARQLFIDAEHDEDAGRWADALDKFRRVGEVKLTSGVRYHVALCEEHLGQLSRALEDFTSAQGQAKADRATDVLRLVGKHLDDLGPRVPRLTVRVVPQATDVTVTLDDAALPVSALGTPLTIDPGVHRLRASAPHHVDATATVTLQERDVTSIDLTMAEAPATPAPAPTPTPPPVAPVAPAPQAAESPAPTSSGGSRTGAIVATAGTGALAVLGVVAYVVAGNDVTSGAQQCATERTASPCDAQKNAVRAWDFTAAGSWVGAAGLGALAVVLWMQPVGTTGTALVATPSSVGIRGSF